MGSKTNDEARRKRSQRLPIMVGVSLLVVFLCTSVAHLQVTRERISLLHALATSRDPYKIRMTLGHLYADAGEYDKAVECYRMALPHYQSKFQERLPLAWEALDQEDPFDPKMHIGFGEMFQRFGDLQQAEMEYKQALTLAPEDIDARARLADVAALKLLVNRDPRAVNPAVVSRDKHYGPDLAVSWRPPSHQGCLVTRCGVSSDSDGHVGVCLVGQSGSSQHDRSALSVLQAADFRELFYYHKAGVFEFACMSDGDTKTIASTEVGGECDFYEPTPNEQLSWQVRDILKRINKQTGALRL